MSARFQCQAFERGRNVYAQGEVGTTLFVVHSGAVKLTRTDADGRRRVLSLKAPGETFGALSLFDPGRRTVTATTVGATSLAALGDLDLRDWMDGRPEVREQVLQGLARELRHREMEAANLLLRDARSRVARLLLALSARMGVPQAGGVRVTHGLKQLELAELAGTSREIVNKALGEFAQQGWVRAEAWSFTVLNAEGLERRSLDTAGRPGTRPHKRAIGRGSRMAVVHVPS